MAKKTAAAHGVKRQNELKSSEPRAIHYYTAPDGTRVREILNVPEPKKLSKSGEWMRDHPNGLEFEVFDMRAVMK